MTLRWSTTDVEAATPCMKILVHGPSGAGKTTLCATTGDPERTLIISAERGLLSLGGHRIRVAVVETFDDVLAVVERLKGEKARGMFRWVCVDSISEIAERCLSAAKSGNRDGRAAYGDMGDALTGLLRELCALPYHVVVLAKQRRNDADNLTTFGPTMPGQKLGGELAYHFDEVFALRATGEGDSVTRWLQTAWDGRFEAKDRSSRLPLRINPPSLATVEAYIYPPAPPAKPEE